MYVCIITVSDWALILPSPLLSQLQGWSGWQNLKKNILQINLLSFCNKIEPKLSKCHWPKGHSGQSVILAKVSLAKLSFLPQVWFSQIASYYVIFWWKYGKSRSKVWHSVMYTVCRNAIMAKTDYENPEKNRMRVQSKAFVIVTRTRNMCFLYSLVPSYFSSH